MEFDVFGLEHTLPNVINLREGRVRERGVGGSYEREKSL